MAKMLPIIREIQKSLKSMIQKWDLKKNIKMDT
jgi:hypothetical protein